MSRQSQVSRQFRVRLANMLKRLFCSLYYSWLMHFVQPGSVLVRLMDATLTSTCKYCMACRAVLLGAGVVLLFTQWAVGLLLISIAVGLTWGERLWLCDPPTPKDSK